MPDARGQRRNRLRRRRGVSPTVDDVASRAGVSTATVSRCLNTPAAVRPALRHRVDSAIAALGYVPHGAARALASQQSYTIGAVIPTLNNAIFASGIQALQRRLDEAKYTLLLASSDYDPARELREVQILVARGVDGIMLVGRAHKPELYACLRDKDVPYVNTWTYSSETEHPCVGFDNLEAGRRLASYLLDMGHRDIAMIAGITDGNDRATERLAGVREALAARGLSLPPQRLLERPYDIAEGRGAFRLLMAKEPRPTAVICGNDVLAFGALFECRSLGVEVPNQLSITGFDDLELASQVEPPLTTMHVPSEEMGRRAAEHLLARLAGKPVAPATRLEVSLIVRGTTAPPRSP
ncbi:MAG: LacI family transcriptional regulator [Candidatus Rokubacteria bacterium GWC2_70_16]|nr:MAG: LacI family transcriptional regulator [Candidatus Rokubacteria bacterium GWC2_70_16]OGL18799.1 MAG: LacI family transcriptional regulator [Candidatus Rokubacteria bacterium RIFCSPLOWO2_12_FULL_71_19]